MDREELSKQLIEKIKLAFETVEYPGDSALFGDVETEELIGKHWKEIPVEIIRAQGRLLRLGQEVLRFYLPAYLINIISKPEKMDVLVDDIMYFLAPSSK